MEATAVFLRERVHKCSNISLLSVSDYLFWQQFQERGRTEAGIQLFSISPGSTGTDYLNSKNVQKASFYVVFIFVWRGGVGRISNCEIGESMH